jgi:murein DD-endopeptidase MepM/ murein hydrolase activator NlpD
MLFLFSLFLLLSYLPVHAQWTSVTPPDVSAYWYLDDVHFASATEGWAVGEDSTNDRGVLLHYHNGTWTSVTPPDVSAYLFLYDVHFTSASEGWAVGYDQANNRGALLHYHNGTWTLVTPPDVSASWALVSTHFTSATEGWAVGKDYINDRGVLLHYYVSSTLSANEGTIGTELILTGSGFGDTKGKVLIGGVATKIVKWTDTMITATVTKVPAPDIAHDVKIMIKPYRTTVPVILPSAFTVKPPELDPLVISHGSPGTEITVTGKYFGTRKGKVSMEDPGTGTKKNCRVTSWHMDTTNGNSELRFVVPKLSKGFPQGEYRLKVANKVGSAEATFSLMADTPGLLFPYRDPLKIVEVFCFGLHPWSADGEIHGGLDIIPHYKGMGYRKYELVASADAVVERIHIFPESDDGPFTVVVFLKVNDYWYMIYTIEPQSVSGDVNNEQLDSIYVTAGQKVRKGEVIGELIVSEPDLSGDSYPHLHFGLLYKNTSDTLGYVIENHTFLDRSDGTNMPPTSGPGSPWEAQDLGIATTLFCPYEYSSPNARAFYDTYPKAGVFGIYCACLCAYGSRDGSCGVCDF